MAYVDQENLLAYFQPVGTLTQQITLSSASANHGEFMCVKPCMVHRGIAAITTAVVATTTAPTVVFAKRPTPGSDTGKTTVLTVTVPNGTAVGKVVYKDVDPVQFFPGDVLLISWTAGVGGTPAGVAVVTALCENSPKTPMENSDMVASV